MSLRRRLLISLGLSFCVLWALAAAWLYSDLRNQMRQTLDQQLAASARMVAGLVAQLPNGAWAQVGKPMLSMPQSTGVACQITSPRGELLVRTHGDFAGRLDAPAPGFTDRLIDGQQWRLFTYIQNGLHITTADRLAERVTLQRNVAVVATVPFVVALLGSLAVLWLGIRRGLRPLEVLRGELSRRDPETLTPIRIDDVPVELTPMIDTLNRLLVRTGDVLMREQRFTSNAAHELRTPLTVIKTHVQLASRLPAGEARAALVNAETGIARLQQTLDQLLLLARVESDRHRYETAPADCASIVDTALADLVDGARVALDNAAPTIAVGISLELAAAALRNLLENALRHTPKSERVVLDIQATSTQLVFTVRDHGDWPSGQSTQNLTQRFWRKGNDQNGYQRGAKGSGLGLSITAAIAKRFDGALDFEAPDTGGLIAHLSLPRSDTAAH
ncbi:ATP-binding protein [Rhodanobacter sp. UC4448_H15]